MAASRMVLLALFLTCLYAVFHAPGHGMAKVAAVVCLAAMIGIPLLTGYAQWWEIAAILVGIGLIALEIFVIPGFGITGIAGIVLFLGGLMLTFVAPQSGTPLNLPSAPAAWLGIQNGLFVIVSGLVLSLLLCWWLSRYLPRLPYFRRLILDTSVGGSATAMTGSLTNIDPMQLSPAVGAHGIALTDLRPAARRSSKTPPAAPQRLRRQRQRVRRARNRYTCSRGVRQSRSRAEGLMSNERMSNQFRMPNDEHRVSHSALGIRHSCFIRHWALGLRHSRLSKWIQVRWQSSSP